MYLLDRRFANSWYYSFNVKLSPISPQDRDKSKIVGIIILSNPNLFLYQFKIIKFIFLQESK